MADLNFLYGSNYIEKTPPKGWEDLEFSLVFGLAFNEANINTNQLTFGGTASEFISEQIALNGVFNGIPFRVTATGLDSNGFSVTVTLFDGYIRLKDREIDSIEFPILYTCFIVENKHQPTVIDKARTVTQQLLIDKGVFITSDFAPCPDIQESKTNIAERTTILVQLFFQTITSILNIIQQIINGISDTISIAFAIGAIELFLAFANAVVVINALLDSYAKHISLFFPAIEYRGAPFLLKFIERGFQYLGFNVDFGIIKEDLQHLVILKSINENNGLPNSSIGNMQNSILNARDFGYTLFEAIEQLDMAANIDFDITGNTVHLKTASDPYWNTAPQYVFPSDILIEITQQYQNGNYNEKPLEQIFFGEYAIDNGDAHTLTAKQDDSVEVRRESTNIINSEMYDFTGLKAVSIPNALCVRKQPFDNLLDLFKGISAEFDNLINTLQSYISQFQNQINTGVNVATDLGVLTGLTSFVDGIQNRAGVLKIEDNTTSLSKFVYLKETVLKGGAIEYRIPENFKDFIGWPAYYAKYYAYDSPAASNLFSGQWIQFKNTRVGFAVEDFSGVISNSRFDFNGKKAKFTALIYKPSNDSAVISGEFQQPFDTTIIETVTAAQ